MHSSHPPLSNSRNRRISLHIRLIHLPETLGLPILIHTGGIHHINQRLRIRATEFPLVARAHDIALGKSQLFGHQGQLVFTTTRLPVFHTRNRMPPRSAKAHTRLRRQRRRQTRGRRGQERRSLGARDSRIIATLKRIEPDLLDHSSGDLNRLSRVPNTQIRLRAADFRGVA